LYFEYKETEKAVNQSVQEGNTDPEFATERTIVETLTTGEGTFSGLIVKFVNLFTGGKLSEEVGGGLDYIFTTKCRWDIDCNPQTRE